MAAMSEARQVDRPSSNKLQNPLVPDFARSQSHRKPEPPDQLPRFSIAGLMLFTGAIAVVLGMLRTWTLFAPGVAVLICFGLALLQFSDRFGNSALLAAQLWAGIVLPATLIAVALMDSHVINDINNENFAIGLAAFWMGPFLLWSICRYFFLPRTAALLAGCLAVTGIYSFMAAFLFSFFGPGKNYARVGKDFWPTLGAVMAIIGIIVAGLVAGVVHFRAMRSAWRRSNRNTFAILMAIWGPLILVAFSQFTAFALFGNSIRPPPPSAQTSGH
jgi:MFS family permease